MVAELTCSPASVVLAALFLVPTLRTQPDDGGDVNANIIQCCDEEGVVEAEEQDVELGTVFRLIW